MFITPSFLRSFKDAFGKTPHQFLIQRRMEAAKDLFMFTDKSITEICQEVDLNH
jgi:AraC-like DNA-binding protein